VVGLPAQERASGDDLELAPYLGRLRNHQALEEKQLVQVEAETRYKAEVPTRVADYMVYLWVRYRLPVSSYVLVLTPSGMPDEVPTSLAIEAGGLRLIVSYRVVRLWEIKAREALALVNLVLKKS
jgi:hypothetical protein